MALSGIDYEIVLRGSGVVVRGRAACDLLPSAFRRHCAELKTGTHADAAMQAEYDWLGADRLLCRVFEPPLGGD